MPLAPAPAIEGLPPLTTSTFGSIRSGSTVTWLREQVSVMPQGGPDRQLYRLRHDHSVPVPTNRTPTGSRGMSEGA
ncbi:MAG: hypothetical protein M3Y22_13735 [Pseudomonadota bacterium]|nr:hypothetical protein [Pseudomonadota bacterium]